MDRLETLATAKRELVNGTETIDQMVVHTEQIQDTVLKGLPPLEDVVNAEEAEDYAREAVANGAKSLGIPVTSQDVELILNSSLEELVDGGYEQLANLSIESFSISSMSSGDLSSDAMGLVSVTAEALRDGKLTSEEAAAIAVSAAKTAGSLVAVASGSLAFGPLGAIAAIPMMAVSFLSADIDEHMEMKRLGLEVAKQKLSDERAAVTAQLNAAQRIYDDIRRDVWEEADNVVSDLARTWHRYEKDLGVAFSLRYFPGEAPPPRGGLWTLGRTISAPCVPVRAEPGGSQYFPTPPIPNLSNIPPQAKGAVASQVFREFEERMARRGLYLKPCKAGGAPKEFYDNPEEEFQFEGYSFFWRTIRALNALLPLGSDGKFWVPEGHPHRDRLIEWKGYLDIVYDEIYAIAQDKPSSVQEAYRSYLNAHAAYEAAMLQNRSFPEPPDISDRVVRYSKSMFLDLFREKELLKTFQVRVLGDLVQTASAVRGEIAAVKQMRRLEGFGVPMKSLTQSDKRSMVVEAPRTTSPLNTWMMLLGGTVAGVGAYKYWRRRG